MYRLPQDDPANALQALLSRLETQYYQKLEQYCDRSALYIAELHNGDVHQTASLYTSLCSKLIGQVTQFLRLRRYGLIPYVRELLEKKSSGHDCRNCAASCTVRHTAQVAGIREAQTRIKETLYRLQSVAVPIYHESLHQDSYRSLRNQMMLLDTALTELFYLEESGLVPVIVSAQNDIHAGS